MAESKKRMGAGGKAEAEAQAKTRGRKGTSRSAAKKGTSKKASTRVAAKKAPAKKSSSRTSSKKASSKKTSSKETSTEKKSSSKAKAAPNGSADRASRKPAEKPDHVRQTERGEAVTFLEAIREALWEEMERDADVFILGEDIGVYGGAFKVTDGFLEHFGDKRIVDTPISEAGFTGAAAGAAHMGMRPVVEMQFMDFVSCAYEPLTNYIATSRWRFSGPVPMVVRGPVGGGVRGGPFHSQNPEMAFFHTPGLKIVYPCTARDAKGLLKAAIRDEDPVLFFEHKKMYRMPALREVLPQEDYVVPLGEARVAREGRDVTIVTYGMMVHESLKAAEQLAEQGIDVEILDLRTLMPLDEDAIVESVKKTNRLLVVHEDTRTGGIAGEIAMRVSEKAFEWLDAPMLRVTSIDTPVPYSPPLEDYFLPGVEDVVKACRYLAEY